MKYLISIILLTSCIKEEHNDFLFCIKSMVPVRYCNVYLLENK